MNLLSNALARLITIGQTVFVNVGLRRTGSDKTKEGFNDRVERNVNKISFRLKS